jgi:gamma-glutamylcysteine synthetase
LFFKNMALKDHLSPVDTETRMREGFTQRAQTMLSRETEFEKDGSSQKLGLEVEYSIVDAEFGPVSEVVRNTAVNSQPEVLDKELGAAQIELHTDPLEIQGNHGFEHVLSQLTDRQRQLQDAVHTQNAHLLSIGANPLMATTDIVRTDSPKYRQVPDFHNNRRSRTDTVIGPYEVEVGDAAIVSILNSVQANIEARSFTDAVDKVNRALMISPLAVCLTANARFLECADTSCADIRMIAWEISHDTRNAEERSRNTPTRVGLPEKYYADMKDYFRQIAQNPFILDVPDHAFEVGIGLNWRDARIKFINNSAIVEFRPVSTQSTPEQNVAAMAFFVGRLAWSQNHKEPLLPMSLVRVNKTAAMVHGMNARLATLNNMGSVVIASARELLPIELERAKVGLRELEIGNETTNRELLSVLVANIVAGTLSEKLATSANNSHRSRKEAIIEGLRSIGAVR